MRLLTSYYHKVSCAGTPVDAISGDRNDFSYGERGAPRPVPARIGRLESFMPTRTVEFEAADGHTLAGKLDEPEGGADAYALFAHCFTCSKDTLAAGRVAKGLMRRGIGVLRFDFTGLGESGGDFHASGFSSNVEDLKAACAHTGAHHGPVRLLIGHSLGGAAVLAAAGSLPDVRGVVTIGAPADPAHVRHLFSGALDEIEREGSAEVSIGGRTIRVGKRLIDDLDATDPERAVGSLGRPLLIFHSPVDSVVGVENAATIYQWARHPKSFVSLGDADHMLSDRRDADLVAGVIEPWAQRFVLGG